MAATDEPVTELVEIPLCVSFDDFLSTFIQQLEPVLLAQPGIISILTGTGSKMTTSGQKDEFAVSLTQWESMEVHGAFLQSPSAGPFFETLQHLTSGPPTINHYHLGPLPPSAFRSCYALFRKYSASDHNTQLQHSAERGETPGMGVSVAGDCLEIGSQRLSVLFSDVQDWRALGDTMGKLGDPASSFGVVWRRRGTARVSHTL